MRRVELRDPAVSLWRKAVGLLAVLYAVFPLDAIPDVIPVIGWLDDLGVISVATWFVLREIRNHAQRDAALPRRER